MWEIFEALCAKNGVSTADVCKATQIAQSTMSNWKKRKNIINVRHGQKIADYFGVSLQYLMTGEDTGAKEIVVPSDRVASDIATIIHDNPVLVEMIYDFADIDEKRYQRLLGYYDAIIRNEKRG